ncbi:MAG: cyclic nucleotide-binding domain-containing protein [Candidatus Latescibacterota bacterium]
MMHRRSGDERRSDWRSTSEERRQGAERRELLKDPDRTAGRLRTIPMFEGLSADQYMKLLRLCSKRTYARNKRIYEIGDEPAEMFILVHGRLRVMFDDGLVLDDHGPSGMVGELGVITGERRTAQVTAVTDCVVLVFNREELHGLFRKEVDLWTAVLTNIIRDLVRKARRDDDAMNELRKRRSLEIL